MKVPIYLSNCQVWCDP